MTRIKSKCPCRACLLAAGHTEISNINDENRIWWMVLCQKCGNKRCPHATDCKLECTGSNEPGQKGSIYE